MSIGPQAGFKRDVRWLWRQFIARPGRAQAATSTRPGLGAVGAATGALLPGGVAVPLRDRHGDVLGALSVTMPMGHESREDAVRRVLSVLSETAQAMRNLI